jgi:hypothetical protein
MEEDHSIAKKAGAFSEPIKSVLTPCTSKTDQFPKWVQAELPKASNHTTVKTKALCRTYQ